MSDYLSVGDMIGGSLSENVTTARQGRSLVNFKAEIQVLKGESAVEALERLTLVLNNGLHNVRESYEGMIK